MNDPRRDSVYAYADLVLLHEEQQMKGRDPMTYDEITSIAAALWDGGWRPGDEKEIAAEYGYTMDEALDICAAMADFE